MTKYIYKLSALTITLFLLSACTKPYQQNTIKEFNIKYPDFSNKFAEKVNTQFRDYGIKGDFLFAVVNERGLAFYYDNSSWADSALSLINKPVYIASHTKAMTGTLTAILNEEGAINIKESLYHYLPTLEINETDTKKIPVQNLLTHTHGLFSTPLTWKTAFLGYGGTDYELIADINQSHIVDTTGRFRYSNVGPILAAMVINEKTGVSWKDLMRDKLFLPLGMDDTFANVAPYKQQDVIPSLTVSADTVFDSGFYKTNVTMHAAGGVLSTIGDLAKWLKANITRDKNILSETGWNKLHSKTVAQDKKYFTYNRFGYSLGWDLAEYNNDKLLTRFGSYGGISVHISFIPEKKTGVIAISNDSRSFVLPHVMANYYYNYVGKRNADSIYAEEVKIFNNVFKKYASEDFPGEKELMRKSTKNDRIKGKYISTTNWPAIVISEDSNNYNFKWGVLSGKIYKNDDTMRSFIMDMEREFRVKNDTLYTGSLVYVKE